jgi:hypothetical protein
MGAVTAKSFIRFPTILDLIFLALLVICVVISFPKQTVTEAINYLELQVPRTHNVDFDQLDYSFRATGEDPYFVIRILKALKPIIGLTTEISYSFNSDDRSIYVYYTPYKDSNAGFKEKWKAARQVSSAQGLTTLKWSFLKPVGRIRIDIPNNAVFTLKALQVEYLIETATWIKGLWIAVIGYWFLRLFVLFVRWFKGATHSQQLLAKHWLWFTILILSTLKVWLVKGQSPFSYPSPYDDFLFLRLAHHILDGDWLGPYTSTTLIKGPMYPIWIAFTFVAGLPLLLAQHLLYIGSCAVLIVALRPFVGRKSVILFFFAILLFNPSTFSTQLLRVIRGGIYPALILLVFACLVGLYTRRDRTLVNMAVWAIGLGLSFSAFWLTREEGLVLLPSVILILGYIGYDLWRSKIQDRNKRMGVCVLPLGIWVGVIISVCTLNYYTYGLFCIVELKTKKFQEAYGSLQRIHYDPWRRYIPVAKGARERIYKVSPAFAELRPYLEGDLGRNWAKNHIYNYPDISPESGEIAGGLFMWAFRDAASHAGYHHNAREAMAYYGRIAEEVNAACESGALRCSPLRASLIPPWRSEYFPLLKDALPHVILKTVTFAHVTTHLFPSAGEREVINFFEDLTLSRLTPRHGELMNLVYQSKINRFKIEILQIITSLYKKAVPILAIIASICYLMSLFVTLLHRHISFLFITSTGILVAFIARVIMLSYYDISSFPSINQQYLAPCYLLLLLFLIMALADFLQLLPRLTRSARCF